MAVKDYTTTAEGIELQFGASHTGHFLLTNLLVVKILAAGKGARIINVSSFGYMAAGVRFDDWNFKVLSLILYGLKCEHAFTMYSNRMEPRTTHCLGIRSPKLQTSYSHPP